MASNCKRIVTLIVRALLSHFGSIIMIISYLIGGGFLFIYLEGANERTACGTSMELFYQKLNDTTMRAVTISNAGYNDTVLFTNIMQMLNDFAADVYALGVSPTMNCTTLGSPGNLQNWNLANSIFFCATLVTTIGYGQIYPVTQWGRIICIIYSFIGIPLMLIFLSNFGVLLANSFRFVYFNCCCCRCFIKQQREPEVEIIEENMKSNGNFNALDEKNKLHESFGPPKMMIEREEETEVEDNRPITIPIIVITAFIALYMFIGTVIFQIWETTWDTTAGLYFTFITISTIGLGDLYPTKNRQMTSDATTELLVAALYCFVGLAVLSMCLNLIQEEISSKLQWLGEKMGLVNNDEDETEDVDPSDFYVDSTKPVIVAKPLMFSVDHENEAFNASFDDNGRRGLYPRLE